MWTHIRDPQKLRSLFFYGFLLQDYSFFCVVEIKLLRTWISELGSAKAKTNQEQGVWLKIRYRAPGFFEMTRAKVDLPIGSAIILALPVCTSENLAPYATSKAPSALARVSQNIHDPVGILTKMLGRGLIHSQRVSRLNYATSADSHPKHQSAIESLIDVIACPLCFWT